MVTGCRLSVERAFSGVVSYFGVRRQSEAATALFVSGN